MEPQVTEKKRPGFLRRAYLYLKYGGPALFHFTGDEEGVDHLMKVVDEVDGIPELEEIRIVREAT